MSSEIGTYFIYEGLEVLVGKRWVRTRIEKAADWYLVGIDTDWLDGLRVRV